MREVLHMTVTLFFFIMSCLTKAVDKILRRGGGFFFIKIQVSIHLVLTQNDVRDTRNILI